MEGGRGARRAAALSSSSTGSSWASFEEKAKDYGTRAGRRERKAGKGGKGAPSRGKNCVVGGVLKRECVFVLEGGLVVGHYSVRPVRLKGLPVCSPPTLVLCWWVLDHI